MLQLDIRLGKNPHITLPLKVSFWAVGEKFDLLAHCSEQNQP